jgi:thiamine-phosphate pyrophosphorylase
VSVISPEQALAAERERADYLGATEWATPTKPEAKPLGLERFAEIVASTPLPVVGIGGITAANVPQVMEAGAAGVAVVSAVGGAADPVAATRALVEVVRRAAPPMR